MSNVYQLPLKPNSPCLMYGTFGAPIVLQTTHTGTLNFINFDDYHWKVINESITPNEMIPELVDSNRSPLLSNYSDSQGRNVNIELIFHFGIGHHR
jgi:hypothetical protein